jgi:DNA-binding MarR family transcriptional regulator
MGKEGSNRATSVPGGRRDLGGEDDTHNRLFFRLFQAANLYERQAQKVLRVSAVQGAILGALSRNPGRGMPLSELVDYLAVSRQNLDGVLKRLEKLGYLERVEDADNRRLRIVRLTPSGLRVWRDLFERTLEFYRLGTRGLSGTTKTALVEGLGQLNRALGTIDESTG